MRMVFEPAEQQQFGATERNNQAIPPADTEACYVSVSSPPVSISFGARRLRFGMG
jgi:hypothetical protein